MLSRPAAASSSAETHGRAGRTRPARKRGRTKVSGVSTIHGVACRLNIQLPQDSWLGIISTTRPEDQIDFASRSDLGDGLRLAGLRVHSPDPDLWMTELSHLPEVVEVSGVHLARDITHVYVIHRGASLVPLFTKAGLLWEFPFPIQGGEATCEVVGTYATVHQLIEEMRELSIHISITKLREQPITPFGEGSPGMQGFGRLQVTNPLEGMYTRTTSFEKPRLPTVLQGSAIKSNEAGHLAICRLRLSLPSRMWVTVFSRKHPEANISIVGQLVADDEKTLVDLQVRSTSPCDWAREIISLPEVLGVDKLGNTGYTSTLRVTFKTHPLYTLFNKLNLMWRMPSPVRDGTVTIAMVGSDEGVRRMVEAWRSARLDVRVESVRHTEEETKSVLTPRQEEIFRKAMAAGYYDVPRRVTLSDLSQSLGLAVSSLSEILAIVEKKLLKRADLSR